MIQVIGICKDMYAHIVNVYPELIEKQYERSGTIIFKKECEISFSKGVLSICLINDCEPEALTVNLLAIDFWRLEIE